MMLLLQYDSLGLYKAIAIHVPFVLGKDADANNWAMTLIHHPRIYIMSRRRPILKTKQHNETLIGVHGNKEHQDHP